MRDAAMAVFALTAGLTLAACGTTAPVQRVSFVPYAAEAGSLRGGGGSDTRIGGVGSSGSQSLGAGFSREFRAWRQF